MKKLLNNQGSALQIVLVTFLIDFFPYNLLVFDPSESHSLSTY